MGLVKRSGNKYQHAGQLLHVKRGNPFNRINHLNWRWAAVDRASDPESVHFTNVFSISKSDWPKLKAKLLDFIETQNSTIHASGAEDVYTFCCDLFPVRG
jgi:hypothetical protein